MGYAKYVVAFEEWVKEEDLGMVASHYDGYARESQESLTVC